MTLGLEEEGFGDEGVSIKILEWAIVFGNLSLIGEQSVNKRKTRD